MVLGYQLLSSTAQPVRMKALRATRLKFLLGRPPPPLPLILLFLSRLVCDPFWCIPLPTALSQIVSRLFLDRFADAGRIQRTRDDGFAVLKGVAERGKCTNTHYFFFRPAQDPPPSLSF